MDTAQLGKKIRILRQNRGLNQENIAEDLKISVTAYSKIERGVTNISFTRLCQIASYFEMTVTALLEWNESSKGNNSSNELNVVSDNQERYISNNITEHLKQEIIQLKELIKAKDEIIVLLKQKNKY